MTASTSAPLSRRTKVIFGLGDWGPTTTSTAFMFFFAAFLNRVAGLSPEYAWIPLLVGGLWDAINDPMMGVLADRVHTRWGRRRPFFLFGAIPYALMFILLWWVPPWSSPAAKTLYYAVVYVLFDTAITVVTVPYTALTPELTEDYDERTRLNGYRVVVSVGGGLVAAVAVPVIAGLFAEPKTGYLVMAVIFGVLAAVPYFLMFFGLRERFSERPEPAPMPLVQAFQFTLRNRAFRYAAGIYLTAWTTVSFVAALFTYYLTDWMRMGDQIEYLLGLLQACTLLFVPLVVFAAARWGKQRAYMVCTAWWVLIMLALAFLPPAAAAPAYVLAALAGVGVAAAHVVPWSIVPDVLEADELMTGRRREASYYGFLVFLQKASTAFALAFMQWVLSLTGWVDGPVQNQATLWGIRLMMGPLPAILLVASIILAWRYPLTRARHAELRDQLAAQRQSM